MKSKLLFFVCAVIACTCYATFSIAQCNNITSGGTVGADQTVCGSYNPTNITNITLPTGGTGTIEYQWQSSPNNTTWTNIAGATLSNYDPPTIGATTYYMRLSRRSGCTTYDGVSNTVTKTLNPLPSASISAGGPTTFCSPGSVTLTANAVAGTTYQWKNSNVNIPGATLQTYAATTSGSYTVVKTISATGCTATSLAVNVIVDDPLSTTISNYGFNVCGASTVQLDVQFGTNYSYQWFEDTHAIPNSNSNQISIGHDGNYACTITNTCGSYPSALTPVNNFQNSGFPVYGTIAAAGSTLLCAGATVDLYEEATAQFGYPIFNGYQWYRNGVSISGAVSSMYTASQAGDYVLWLTVFNPCTFNYVSYYTDWLTITASGQSLPAPVISAGGPTIFCPGGSVTLTSTVAGNWTRNGSAVGVPGTTYTATTAGTYQCAATNTCGTGFSNTIVVEILPLSNVINLLGPSTICSSTSAPMYSSSGGTGATYQWKLNGNIIGGATQITYNATATGSYTCSFTNACTTNVSNAIAITVNANCGTGLQYDGTNDIATVPNNAAYAIGTGDFTIETWLKVDPNQISSQGIIFSNRTSGFNGLTIFVNGTNFAVVVNGSTGYFNRDLRDSLCHHLTVTRLNGSLSVYVDGMTGLGGAFMTGNITTTGILSFGSMPVGGSYFKGKMMEMRFWNYSRTLTQIQNAMNAMLNGSESGLIGYWKMDDGSGQVINDCSTTNNDGQLGTTSSTDVNDPIFAATCAITGCTSPIAVITPNGPTTFCTGGSVILNANTGVGLFYQWRFNANPISGATLSSYTASTAGNYSCFVSNTCTSSLSNTIVVAINTVPSATITAGGATTFCTGGSVTLNANTGTGLTYQWKVGGSPISGATASSYVATLQGSYTCAVTNICGTITSNSITVTVNVLPNVIISASGSTTICNGSNVQLSTNTGVGFFYQWYLNGNTIALATQSSYNASVSGTYTCLVSGPCGSVLSNTITVTVISAPATPDPINGITSVCANTFSVSFSVPPVSGAASYTWTVPAGATVSGGQGTPNAEIDFGPNAVSGNICVTASNTCGSTQRCLNVTVSPIPVITNQITGSASACANTTNNIYSISGVIGATSFTWTIPTGASFVSGQGTSTVTLSFGANGATGNICVYAGNSCGTNFTCKAVTAVTGTTTPTSISGTTTPCANSIGVFYSCPPVAGASSYNWTVPATATITSGQGTTDITVNFNSSFTSGTIGVSSVNCAGTSAPRTISVYGTPVMPGTITGPSSAVCGGTTNVQYSIAAVTGATSYTWTAPMNATITNGQGTATVRINFGNGFSSGTLSVRAVNSCGTSAARTLAISSVPPMPGAINGPATFCANSNVNYSVAAVTGATTYNWDVPVGASITSGQGTTTVTVHHGTHSGKIKVRAGNGCGYSAYQILNVTKTCREGGDYITDESGFDISVFPNPSASQFTISVKGMQGEKYNFILRDLTGRIIEMRENQLTDQSLDFGSNLQNGIYVAEIIMGDERKWIRIIKQE